MIPLWHKKFNPERLHDLRRNASSNAYKAFKNAVLERDEYTCQMCNKTKERDKVKLEVHHILKFAENEHMNMEVDNGITLCRGCHKSIFAKEFIYERFFLRIILAKKKMKEDRENSN